ncbi:MAG TPA: hypothetical protein VFL93_06645 [Longimicrobiaceae bacterium]|nr:hypothetical protein [Longimicrobiaceae bacterium]
MTVHEPAPLVLIGPRKLNDRICRLMYVRETDEAWTEEWTDRAWVRSPVLVRHLLSAPAAKRATLARRGIPAEVGEWDREQPRAVSC